MVMEINIKVVCSEAEPEKERSCCACQKWCKSEVCCRSCEYQEICEMLMQEAEEEELEEDLLEAEERECCHESERCKKCMYHMHM